MIIPATLPELQPAPARTRSAHIDFPSRLGVKNLFHWPQHTPILSKLKCDASSARCSYFLRSKGQMVFGFGNPMFCKPSVQVVQKVRRLPGESSAHLDLSLMWPIVSRMVRRG
jgi:hypothetical protein